MNIVRIQGEKEKSEGIYYEVDFNQKPIGFGGMGTVMRGVRVESRGERINVAIKFLFDDLPQNAVDRARREASIQLLNDNLVRMYGFVETDVDHVKRLHVVSELLDGIMLHDFLQGTIVNVDGEEVPFFTKLYDEYCRDKEKFAVFIIKNILSGIMALHDAGFIHRDIDPSNIMLTTDGKIKLIDFGVARKISANSAGPERQLTTEGNFIGKANYAAPELAVGDIQHQNATTDIYAIGILLYQIIIGKLPFEGPIVEVLQQQIGEPLPVQNIKNPGIKHIVSKATAKKQRLRYQSAAEFRVALEQWENAPGGFMGDASAHMGYAGTSTSFLDKVADMSIGLLAAFVSLLGVGLGVLSYYLLS